MTAATKSDLRTVAALLDAFPGTVLEVPADDLGGAALAYANAGWEVFPLRGKLPALTCPITREYRWLGLTTKCPGGCGNEGHGVLDAADDVFKVGAWWTAMPRANIGGRVPAGIIVIDIDPRHDGDRSMAALEAAYGPMPATRTCISGRGDGGRHIYVSHPGGPVVGIRLGDGVDLKTHAGYCVLPPSIHPDTRRPYSWLDPAAPIAPCPTWLADLLRPQAPKQSPKPVGRPHRPARDGESVADWFTRTTTWAEILVPAGWHVIAGDGDQDGSAWRHPTATSALSATVRHGLLFVYSTNTALPVTGAGDPHGLTRFRGWAHLEHGGDLSAAARAAGTMRKGMAA